MPIWLSAFFPVEHQLPSNRLTGHAGTGMHVPQTGVDRARRGFLALTIWFFRAAPLS